MHEEFANLPNCLTQLVISAPDDPEIHMEFDNALLLAPIADDTCIGRSGQRLRTPSDLCISSNVASNALSDGEDAEDDDIDNAQRMDIDAPHTRIPGTPHERETNPIIDDPTTSRSAIIANPSKIN
jgi:hypothetical protein